MVALLFLFDLLLDPLGLLLLCLVKRLPLGAIGLRFAPVLLPRRGGRARKSVPGRAESHAHSDVGNVRVAPVGTRAAMDLNHGRRVADPPFAQGPVQPHIGKACGGAAIHAHFDGTAALEDLDYQVTQSL